MVSKCLISENSLMDILLQFSYLLDIKNMQEIEIQRYLFEFPAKKDTQPSFDVNCEIKS